MLAAEFMSRAPTLVTAPIYVALTLYISIVIGRRVVLLFGARTEAAPSEKFVLSAAIGLGLTQFVPFLLGAVGLLSTLSVRFTLAVILGLCLFDLPAIVAAARG